VPDGVSGWSASLTPLGLGDGGDWGWQVVVQVLYYPKALFYPAENHIK